MLNIIWNPTAGKGKARSFHAIISARLKEQGVDVRFWETAASGDAKAIARRLTEQGETEITAMGGDGTLHEVLNGMVDPSKVSFGIIPCGSGNDFAATAGIPVDAEGALDILLNEPARPTDYLECGPVRSLNIIGTGLDVDILHRCYRTRHLKGSANYFVSLLISILDFTLKDAVAKWNGKDRPFGSLISCACNGTRFGGGLSICPTARIDDGKLDIVLIENVSKPRIPAALLALLQKRILKKPFVMHDRTGRLTIDFKQPQTIEIDGELYDGIPFDVRVIPGGMNLHRRVL